MADTVIENPTYLEHVRHFFVDEDLDHMIQRGHDLSTYQGLKNDAGNVVELTAPPEATMPPPETGRAWSQERNQSFVNWKKNGFLVGVPTLQEPQPDTADRVRKDVRDLSKEELTTLTRAFRGLMDRPPGNPTSYFDLAGIHGLPDTAYCKHHQNLYNPWHRVYLRKFEDALRTIEGCAGVTLPYWDITSPLPNFLFQPPFDSYDVPIDIGSPFLFPGHPTSRLPAATIEANIVASNIPNTIVAALQQPIWHDFNQVQGANSIVAAHDDGHLAIGGTMPKQEIAAFDPLFWFFHANWDRLWWDWQQIMQATTFWTFRSTVVSITETGAALGTAVRFLKSGSDALEPWSEKAAGTIDLSATNVAYAAPHGVGQRLGTRWSARPGFGNFTAARRMRVQEDPLVSVRLKGIDRLAIPGSFQAILKADGEPIGRRGFFQATDPNRCENCRENAVVDLDFLVDAAAIRGRDLTVDLEVVGTPEGMSPRFPLSACGDPTLNVRMLIGEAQ
ncbi:MAG: tyrosinase family protein [Pseudonocardiaceae bacterium]